MATDESAYKWSTQEYTLQDLYTANEFPVAVKVIRGFCGDTDSETMSTGDMLWVHSRGSQERAIAYDISSTSSVYYMYSIPLDYQVPFAKVKEGSHNKTSVSGQAQTLHKLLRKDSLPFRVKMILNKHKTLNIAADPKQKLGIDVLEVQDVFEEKFLKINSILHGVVHQEQQAIPTYLKEVCLVKAEGLAGRHSTPDQWDRVRASWEACTKALSYEDLVPSKDIKVYSKDKVDTAEKLYESIEPHTYATLSDVTKHSEEAPHTESTPTPSANTSHQEKGKLKNEMVRSMSEHGPTPPPIKKFEGEKETQMTESKARGTGHSSPDPLRIPPKPMPKPQHNEANVDTAQLILQNGKEKSKEKKPLPVPVKTVEDIPADISSLNCRDMLECLRLMKMEKYEEVFKENQINGALLSALDEDIMKGDLGISAIHARKLQMFAHKGWRPEPLAPADMDTHV